MCVSAAAAMALAVPISAWQPPSAPATLARNAVTWPNPAAIYSACRIVSSATSRTSTSGISTAGQHAAAARRGRGDDALHARIALGHLERLFRHALKIRPAEEAAGLRRRAGSAGVAADEPVLERSDAQYCQLDCCIAVQSAAIWR